MNNNLLPLPQGYFVVKSQIVGWQWLPGEKSHSVSSTDQNDPNWSPYKTNAISERYSVLRLMTSGEPIKFEGSDADQAKTILDAQFSA